MIRHVCCLRVNLAEKPASTANHRVSFLSIDSCDHSLLTREQLRRSSGYQCQIWIQPGDATDRAIDALVYQLYDLSPAEIAIVEGRDA